MSHLLPLLTKLAQQAVKFQSTCWLRQRLQPWWSIANEHKPDWSNSSSGLTSIIFSTSLHLFAHAFMCGVLETLEIDEWLACARSADWCIDFCHVYAMIQKGQQTISICFTQQAAPSFPFDHPVVFLFSQFGQYGWGHSVIWLWLTYDWSMVEGRWSMEHTVFEYEDSSPNHRLNERLNLGGVHSSELTWEYQYYQNGGRGERW